MYAGSADSYTLFSPFFDRIIEEYHHHSPEALNKSDWDYQKLQSTLQPLDNNYCVSTRMRVARNLEGYPLGPFISKEQRKEVE